MFDNRNKKNNIKTDYKDNNDGDGIFLKIACCILLLSPPCLAKNPDLSNTANMATFHTIQSSLLADFMAISASFLTNASN